MKIQFKMSGGFAHLPALNRPILIDTTQIDPHLAHQLESYVRASQFFEQPAQTGAPTRGAADYQTYTITVEEGSNIHTLQLTDPITDTNLHRLVSKLRDLSSQTSSEAK